jgi:hypothetical protein
MNANTPTREADEKSNTTYIAQDKPFGSILLAGSKDP